MVSVDAIKELRDKTGAGIMDCKSVLIETKGDIEKAVEILKQRGLAIAEKKATRVANQGIIEAYVHPGGRIGAMIELNCESDFVARTDEFKQLAHDLALQVAGFSPQFISLEEMPEGADIDPKVACLLLQPFFRDPEKAVQDVIAEIVAKVSENIRVRRFVRFEIGD